MGIFRAAWIVLSLFLAGCLGATSGEVIPPGQLDVFGVTLHSPIDHRQIGGVPGVDEPCLRGFERSFDGLDIVLGYGRDGRIRRITSRNPQTTVFGVRPGEPAETARAKLRSAGFVETTTPNRFSKAGLVLILLVDTAGRAFGVTLEADDR